MAESSKSYNIAGLPNGKWENRSRSSFQSGVLSCKAIHEASPKISEKPDAKRASVGAVAFLEFLQPIFPTEPQGDAA